MENEKRDFQPVNAGGFKMFMLLFLLVAPFVIGHILHKSFGAVALTLFNLLVLRNLLFALWKWYFRGYNSVWWALRCIARDDCKRAEEFFGRYFANNVCGHDTFSAFKPNSSLVESSETWPVCIYSQNAVVQIPVGGWFRKPRLWVRGQISEFWTLRVKRVVGRMGWWETAYYLVDRNGDKLPLSVERILTVLKANYDYWNSHTMNPTNCVAVMQTISSELDDKRKEVIRLNEKSEALTEIAFSTIEELAESKGTFGKHPGGKAVRASLGRKLLRLFPNDTRLAVYKQNAA